MIPCGPATCTRCGRPAAPAEWRCPCGGLLDLPETAAHALRDLPPAGTDHGGLWRYRDCIPVSGKVAAGLSLGEGLTPLIGAGGELPGVGIKLEYLFPTLSFKDRGAVVLVASALQRGARALIADSSGNAGSAIAAYAARAGLSCTVFVPAATSPGKREQIRAYGATLQSVPGDRTAASVAAIEAVSRTGAMYASHVYDPYFVQGTKTFAFELWEQGGGEQGDGEQGASEQGGRNQGGRKQGGRKQGGGVPGAVVVPVGNGTLLLGAARGFRELHRAGLIERPPALVAVQSERCAPLARAWAIGAGDPVDVDVGQTLAEGIAIPHPPRGAQILAGVEDSGGCMVSVPESAIAPAQADLARRGLFVEPTAAVTWAAMLLIRRHRALAGVAAENRAWETARALAAGSVVVPLCGAGLKALGAKPVDHA